MYVDVIIPTYKPDKNFIKLIDLLEKQSVLPFKIIIINTEKQYFDELLKEDDILTRYTNIRVYHISKSEFDHANSRMIASKHSDADFMLFMTDDAIPTDKYLIANLVSHMDDEQVAVAYARQLAREGASEIEKYGREFNYPDKSIVKSKEDIETLGIKTFFCSNVCALYRGDLFRQRGGFVKSAIFNEDMYYAGDVVMDGYRIAYAADATVIHSHDYGPMQQFHRNFDLGVSQAMYPRIFDNVKSEGEGIKLVKGTIKHLLRNGKFYLIPAFCINCAFKLAGYRLGKKYKKLSKKKILRYTMNKEYWYRVWEDNK